MSQEMSDSPHAGAQTKSIPLSQEVAALRTVREERVTSYLATATAKLNAGAHREAATDIFKALEELSLITGQAHEDRVIAYQMLGEMALSECDNPHRTANAIKYTKLAIEEHDRLPASFLEQRDPKQGMKIRLYHCLSEAYLVCKDFSEALKAQRISYETRMKVGEGINPTSATCRSAARYSRLAYITGDLATGQQLAKRLLELQRQCSNKSPSAPIELPVNVVQAIIDTATEHTTTKTKFIVDYAVMLLNSKSHYRIDGVRRFLGDSRTALREQEMFSEMTSASSGVAQQIVKHVDFAKNSELKDLYVECILTAALASNYRNDTETALKLLGQINLHQHAIKAPYQNCVMMIQAKAAEEQKGYLEVQSLFDAVLNSHTPTWGFTRDVILRCAIEHCIKFDQLADGYSLLEQLESEFELTCESTLLRATLNFKERNYEEVVDLCERGIKLIEMSKERKPLLHASSLELRGLAYSLLGLEIQAVSDFQECYLKYKTTSEENSAPMIIRTLNNLHALTDLTDEQEKDLIRLSGMQDI